MHNLPGWIYRPITKLLLTRFLNFQKEVNVELLLLSTWLQNKQPSLSGKEENFLELVFLKLSGYRDDRRSSKRGLH